MNIFLSADDYATSPKSSTSALPNFNRFGTPGGVTSHGGVSLPGFTSHRGSPYSPAPAPAHTPSLSYSPSGESPVGNPPLWGTYDAGALQQYSVVTSGNSAVSRGRTPSSVASMSAAASLSASKYIIPFYSVKVTKIMCLIQGDQNYMHDNFLTFSIMLWLASLIDDAHAAL